MQHLDEGTIHAWLDGQLPADKADEIAAHASGCPDCGAMVAEARGLVAASTRILTALDNVPAGVTPVPSVSPVPIVRRRWYDRTDIRVAAALLFVAGASLVVVRGGRDSTTSRASVAIADKIEAMAPVTVDTASVQSSGAETPTDNRSASGSAEHPPVASVVSPGRTPSRQKAMAEGLSPSAKPSVDEMRALNAPVMRVRAQESRTMSDAATKLAAVPPAVVQAPAPAPIQSDANARHAPATGAALEEIVVTSVGARLDVAAAPLRVQRTDSTARTTRTIYKISPGVEVTLTESRADTSAAGNFSGKEVRANEAASQLSADAAKEKDFGNTLGAVAGVSGGRADQANKMATAPAMPLNTISWTDRGRRYTLTGRLTKKDLEVLKARLMAMRR